MERKTEHTCSSQETAPGQSPGVMRYGLPTDYNRVEAIWLEAFPGDTPSDVREYWDRFFHPARILVWEQEEETIGMLSVFDIVWNGAPAAYVYALGVDRRFRKQGIARSMLTEVSLRTRCPVIVHPEHNGVETYYRKLGFYPVPEAEMKIMAKQCGIEDLIMDSGDGFVLPYRS